MRINRSASATWLLAITSLLSLGVHVRAQDAVMARQINDAIDRGAAYLRKYSEGAADRKRPASWALRGWALLETGVSANDPAIAKSAEYVRQEVPEMDRTYDIALAIIFLDKLGDAADTPLIESLAVRLVASQGDSGGWDYGVDQPNKLERSRLAKLIADSETLRRQGLVVRTRTRTPQEIAGDQGRQFKAIKPTYKDTPGDNSNTQFAMMALWVARRHGVPVNNSMELVEKRFQSSQVKTGAWGYVYPARPPAEDDTHFAYPAMTCAGLLGLALGQGVQPKPRDLLMDAQVKRGLAILSDVFDSPPAGKKRNNYLYYLFSLERMAVVYNLQKIGAHDWYLKGAGDLLKAQGKDGAWRAGFEQDGADTCFALLFLKRANVARDLTEILAVPIQRAPGAKGRVP